MQNYFENHRKFLMKTLTCFNSFCRGDCCTSKTSIIAVDSAGNTKSSSINFSGENEFGISSYIKVSTSFKLTFTSKIDVGTSFN